MAQPSSANPRHYVAKPGAVSTTDMLSLLALPNVEHMAIVSYGIGDVGLATPNTYFGGMERDTANFPTPTNSLPAVAKAIRLWQQFNNHTAGTGYGAGNNYEGMVLILGWESGPANDYERRDWANNLPEQSATLLAAYSTWRRIVSGSTTPLLRVRRTSDNAEQDFPPANSGFLNQQSLTQWLSSANGAVTTIYQQTGTGGGFGNLTQTTNARQPLIAAAGTIFVSTPGSTPRIFFDGIDDRLVASTAIVSTNYSYGLNTNIHSYTEGVRQLILNSNSATIIIYKETNDELWWTYNATQTIIFKPEFPIETAADNTYFAQARKTSGTNALYKNFNSVSLSSGENDTAGNFSGMELFGGSLYNPIRGYFSEFVIYDGHLTKTDREFVIRHLAGGWAFSPFEEKSWSLLMNWEDKCGSSHFRTYSVYHAEGIANSRTLQLAEAVQAECSSAGTCYPGLWDADNEDFNYQWLTSAWVTDALANSRASSEIIVEPNLTLNGWFTARGVTPPPTHLDLHQLLVESAGHAIKNGWAEPWKSVLPSTRFGNFHLFHAAPPKPYLAIADQNIYNLSMPLDLSVVELYWVHVARALQGESRSETWRRISETNLDAVYSASAGKPIVVYLLWPDTPPFDPSLPNYNNYIIPTVSDLRWFVWRARLQYGVAEFLWWTWPAGSIPGWSPDPLALKSVLQEDPPFTPSSDGVAAKSLLLLGSPP